MPEKKVIAVIGATGAQGGGLVDAILEENGKFAVRAVVHYALSEKALALKKRGVEVVEADVNDETAVTQAIQGAYGLFCVSFYQNHMDPEQEQRQAKHMAFGAREAGVKHVIWSTLENAREHMDDCVKMPTLKGHYKVPTFEGKAEGDRYFVEADVKTTYLVTSFYWDNFINNQNLRPQKMSHGDKKWQLFLPMGEKRLAGIASEDIGRCALGIFHRPDEYINQRVGVMGEALTGWQIAEKMSAVLKKEICYTGAGVNFDDYRSQMISGAAELGNMFQYFHDYESEVMNQRSVEESRKLNPNLMTFDQWLQKNCENFIAKLGI